MRMRSPEIASERNASRPESPPVLFHPALLCALLLACALLCALACAGCGQSEDTRKAGQAHDYVICEQEVIDYIAQYREEAGLSSDEEWKAWLEKKGTTAKELRSEVVKQFGRNYLIRQAAELRGVSVGEGDVDAKLEEERGKYGSALAWQRALNASGYTEDAYRDQLRSDLQKEAIKATFSDPASVDDDELLAYANNQAANLSTRRTSAVFVAADDANSAFAAQAQARTAHDKLVAGEDFAAVFAEYSSRRYSEDGDMGYDCVSTPSSSYREAVLELEVGDVSEPVLAGDGYFVIVCTDHFDNTDKGSLTKLSKFPDELLEVWRTELAQKKTGEDFIDFYNENVEEVEIAVEPLPEGLPYDVQ